MSSIFNRSHWKAWIVCLIIIQLFNLCIAFGTPYAFVSTPILLISVFGLTLLYCEYQTGVLVHIGCSIILACLCVIPFSVTVADEYYAKKYWSHILIYTIVIALEILAILLGLYVLHLLKKGAIGSRAEERQHLRGSH